MENASPKASRDDQRPERAGEAVPGPHQVERDGDDLRRQHHRADDRQEQRVAASELQLRQGVRRRDAGHQHQDGGGDRVDDRVQQIPRQRRRLEDLDVVLRMPGLRPVIAGERLVAGHQREQHQVADRGDEHDRQGDRDAVPGDEQQGAFPAPRRRTGIDRDPTVAVGGGATTAVMMVLRRTTWCV